MIFYLEGPDGAGKTTLGKSIARVLEATGQRWWGTHHGPPKDIPAWEYYGNTLWNHQERLKSGPGNLIMDRAWLSHHVYEPVFGRKDQLERTYPALECWAQSMDRTLLILCLPPFHVCRENWLRRADEGKELITREQEGKFLQAYSGFEERPVRTTLPFIMHNYTKEEGNTLISDQLVRMNDPLKALVDNG